MMQDNNTPFQEATDPEVIRTDGDTVRELVEMKFLSKKRNKRLRTPTQRFFSRNPQVFIDNDATTHAPENVEKDQTFIHD